ncbi:HAD-IIIA family hydrolase [Solwaraspora sp. WMMD406]|uniref:HAD-IIIA family hydrolase n=1 Tax=Solwaraspora sp. WMMD406 TaxID=3016095 RepID=UPI002417301E|nr:HAD-IIIA family hydrolase [Solwaraspora sp. WMMD406]MDG4766601.1 HAD-IIIA family hydrolase [Solwaraspora sp. WMMD406]
MRSEQISRSRGLFDAVLFDRDGTLVHDVPYNGDPRQVRVMPGARAALDRLRAAGLRIGVVTNQSGLARGHFTADELARVHDRIEELLGPFDTWQVCPHDEGERCRCRKPAPGMIHAAASALRTVAARCVVVGDIGRDMAAAGAAGATAIMVPTEATWPAEIAAAPAVAGDLTSAVDLILRRHRMLHSRPAVERRRRVLVVRSDSVGDVLVTGPAIRAVAAGADEVVMLCGPRGRAAAELLPGVAELIEWPLPWIDPEPAPVEPAELSRLTDRLATIDVDEAIIFTSFHQSPLPLAVLLRMAGVVRIAAISDDYPGSLLDVRHRVPAGVPEAERALSLAAAAGFPLPDTDEPVLRLRPGCLRPATSTGFPAAVPVGPRQSPAATESPGGAPPGALPGGSPGPVRPGYVVVHPGSSVQSRACPPERCAEYVTALRAAGHRVVVTGGPHERALSAMVAGRDGTDLGGQTSLGRLAAIIASASALVVGNTGPAHLAAAVGTPVVSLFAPTVPFGQWGPYRVPWVRLGDPMAACGNTRAARCPVPGHPCLTSVRPQSVVEAVELICGTAA